MHNRCMHMRTHTHGHMDVGGWRGICSQDKHCMWTTFANMCVTVRGPNFCEYNMNETIKSVTLEIMPRKKQKHSKLGVNCLQKSPFSPETFRIWSRCCTDGKLKHHECGHGNWFERKTLKSLGVWAGGTPPPPGSGQGAPPPLPPHPHPKVIFMEINSTFLFAQPPTGTTSVTTRWKPPHFKPSYDYQHPKHHLTPVRTPLLSYLNWKLGPATYEIKIKNCKITEMHTDMFQASFPHKFSLSAQVVIFFRKVASIKLEKYKMQQNKTKRRSFECPTGFSRLRPTRPIRLMFTDTHSNSLTQPQSLNLLPWFTTWATVMANLSLSKLLEHSLHRSR